MTVKTDLGELWPLSRGVDHSGDGNVRWAIIAATSREEAVRYLAGRGLSASLVRSKSEVAADPLGFWRELRLRDIDVLAVHSRAWRRQRSSEFFEVMLAAAPVNRRLIVDGESGAVYEVNGRQLALRLSRAPAEVIQGLGMAAREIAAFKVASRRPPKQNGDRSRDLGAVVAIWHGLQTAEVGGAATHIAGILSGFRTLGLRIGLVTTEPPPPQLASILDEVEVVPPLPPGARLTTDTEELTMNRLLEKGALSLVRRLGPSLIYQRHRQFLWAGARVACMADAPLVLEWNNSEAWSRQTYDTERRLGRLLNPIVEDVERYMLQVADLTVAVSSLAADMALTGGADPARVAVIPNGVNLEEIAQHVEETGGRDPGQQPLIGWVGAFCHWHGAEVLVQSLPFLRPTARLLLIGDGERRPACESLARELGVSERVELPGALPHAETVRRLAQCDILVSPHVEPANHRFLGSPTKLFEYMAIGRPIVASQLEQIGEVLEDGITARLVPPGDERRLASAIERILSSPDRGEALGLSARREAERHSWDRRARSILDRLERVPSPIAATARW